jgi:acyl carrier protein
MKNVSGKTVNLVNQLNGPTLESLRRIWEDALERKIEDETQSFFDNGGDSLGATIILSRIKQEFNVELSLEDFFNHPALNDLLDVVELRHREAE